MWHRSFLILFVSSVLLTTAYAQPIQQSGQVTPGHAGMFITNGVLGDAGTAAQGKLSSLGITASGNSFCINSDLTSAAGWQQFCFGVTTASGASISVQNFGTAPAQGVSWAVNGTASALPLVALPTTTNDFACYSNTTGSLKDCGVPTVGVSGPGTTVVGDMALWANTTGTSLSDFSGTANNLIYWSGTHSVANLATANSRVLATNGSGVPAWVTSLPSGLTIPGYIPSGGTTVVGDIPYWTNTSGSAVGDAPLSWVPNGGVSGNGGFTFTSPGGVGIVSTDVTTTSSRINLGGTVNAGVPVCFTLNYNNAALTARSVQICYTPIGGDTLSNVATGLANALVTASHISPLSVDFNTLAASPTFQFFNPGTVASAGVQVAFNFYWLGSNAGTPSLNIVNSSNPSTTVTETINGNLTGIGATGGAPPLTLDTVPQQGCTRGSAARAGVAGDIICLYLWQSYLSNLTSHVYGSLGFTISNPAAATPLGLFQVFTDFANPAAAIFNIAQGMYLNNATGALTPTYPGVLANCIGSAVSDPGTGSIRNCGWNMPGRALVGTWPANTSYAVFGTNALDQSNQANYAIVQGVNGDTLVNSASGQNLQFRIGNVSVATVASTAVSFEIDQNSATNLNLTNNSGGTSALAQSLFSNGTNNLTAGMGGTAFSNGLYQGRGYLTANGAALVVGTSTSNPYVQIINNAEVGRWDSITPGRFDIGVAGTTAGQIQFSNATSGAIVIVPPTGALGTQQLNLPAVTGTFLTTSNTGGTISTAVNYLGSDVTMNNTANYFDGPSTAQGTSGTWFASGTVTLTDTVGAASSFYCKLWDGNTVIASAATSEFAAANDQYVIALSGVLASPANNIKISCRDVGATTGKILFNASGNSKDSTLTAIRIN
jgi:hypothetical protein